MHVLVAPDKFKHAASARAVAHAMGRGVRAAGGTVDLCPVADGGEGTVDALGGERRTTVVTGPLGAPVAATWAILDDGTAVIEMASAAGLALVSERDPLRATTRGVGELIAAALDAGCTRLIVGMGGSATVDGGRGAVEVLQDRDLSGVDLVIACDVDNTLADAARVYGPQKGATPEMVAVLEERLAEWGQHGDPTTPGTGAAGGLAFGLATFCGGRLVRGVDLVLDRLDFAARAARADLVLTGEGRLDGQSLHGKVILGVARAAAGTPVVALVGQIGPDVERVYEEGVTAVFSIVDGPMTLEEALRRTEALAEAAAANVVRAF